MSGVHDDDCRSCTTVPLPRIRLAPTTVQCDGTSRVRRRWRRPHAATYIRTAPRIFAPAPMHTLSSITGAAGSDGCLLPMVTCCMTVTRLPMDGIAMDEDAVRVRHQDRRGQPAIDPAVEERAHEVGEQRNAVPAGELQERAG